MTRQITRIPVAKNGLHSFKDSFPFLGSFKFMEVCPTAAIHYRKGEKFNIKGNAFSRLNPLVNPAFVTGRYNFKGFFCPYKYVFRPWYYFDNGTPYPDNKSMLTFEKAPFTSMQSLNRAFITPGGGYCQSVPISDPTYTDVDFFYFRDKNGSVIVGDYFRVTDKGRKVLKILNALGYTPTWNDQDTDEVNILSLLAYIRIFANYYFPNQYVGNSRYQDIVNAISMENNNYDSSGYMDSILEALYYCSCAFYEDSFFDSVFDYPFGSNVINDSDRKYSIQDITNDALHPGVITTKQTVLSPYDDVRPVNNPTPFLGNEDVAHYSAITQYVNSALQKLSNFLQRHQLAGGRLVDRILAERGEKVSNDYVMKPYYLGEFDVEMQVSPVENNSDTNLGELAGKGYAASDLSKPLKFDGVASDDGVLIIVATAKPDAEYPICTDIFNYYVKQLDFLHPEFDKLGTEYIPSQSLHTSIHGYQNWARGFATNFGFGSRYCGYRVSPARLVGDFRLNTKGAQELASYYGFRSFGVTFPTSPGVGPAPAHSFDFIDGLNDSDQYQRFFSDSESDNLLLYVRWFRDDYIEKLPFGESFDWNEDEYKEKVSVVLAGSQK